jgi:hypothetical protein
VLGACEMEGNSVSHIGGHGVWRVIVTTLADCDLDVGGIGKAGKGSRGEDCVEEHVEEMIGRCMFKV